MASSSTTAPALYSNQISEKLTRENHLLWKAQVLPQIRGAGLYGYLDGSVAAPEEKISTTDKEGKVTSVPNPDFIAWRGQDQQVLSYIINSLSKEMANFDQRVELLQGTNSGFKSSANMAARGRGRGRGAPSGRGGGRGSSNTRGGSSANGNNNAHPFNNTNRGVRTGNINNNRPTCQICGKSGHTAMDCWYRFTDDYLPEEKSAGAANLSSYGVDTNWYADSGATNHITGELEKLTVRDNYRGTDQIHTADGSGPNNGENSLSRQM